MRYFQVMLLFSVSGYYSRVHFIRTLQSKLILSELRGGMRVSELTRDMKTTNMPPYLYYHTIKR